MERRARTGAAAHRRPVGGLVRLRARGRPRAARGQHGALRAVAGPGPGPQRSDRPGRQHLAHDGGAGQRRRLARGRAGRRAQRLCVPPGGRGLPARRGRGAAHRRQRRAAHGRLRGGLRGGHPRGRVPGPQPLRNLPHHGHGRHAGRRRGGGAPAGAEARADAARLRLGRHAVGRAVGVPAHRRRQQATAHGACRRRRADGGLPGPGRLHRRAGHLHRPAGPGGRHVHRRQSGQAQRRAGPRPRPASSGMPRAATRTRRPMRCCR